MSERLRHLALAPLAVALLVACDAAPRTDLTRIAHERPVAHATGPTAEPDPDPADPDPDPADPDPDPVDPDPDPVDPDPDPVDPDPDPVDPDPDPVDVHDPDPDPVDDPDPGVLVVTAFPYVHRGDTTGAPAALDRYGCAPATREGGPEVVYRVTLPDDGVLVASLDDITTGVDVDVHIVADADVAGAIDPAACFDRGNWVAAAWLPAGTYHVVADTWVDASGHALPGAYTLTLGFTAADAFVAQDLSPDVLGAALVAFGNAWAMGDTERTELTVIDFSRHSSATRLWTLDLFDGSLIFDERVTHGEGSDDPDRPGYARAFSNVEGSHQSSLGLMRTATRYQSASNGLSLRLDGLEPGINDAVRERAIVMHSDAYASAAYVASHGRMGTSWGCQVVDPLLIDDVVATLEGGSLVWSWFPDPALDDSLYLEGWQP